MTESAVRTTVACSYYLSAQSESAAFNQDMDNSASYQRSFGRSPECTSYAKARNDPGSAWGKLSYSNCGSNASGTLLPPLSYVPLGLDGLGVQALSPALYGYIGPLGATDESCCGSCQFQLDKIRLIYFRTNAHINCTQGQNTTTELYKALSSSSGFMKRAHSLETNTPVVVVSSGYTFTYPSIYLEMLGTANVKDHCGTIDRVATGTIVALPENGVSTLSFDIPVGSTILAMAESGGPQILLQSLKPYTKILNTKDLACPTWGFAGVSYIATTTVLSDALGRKHPYAGNLTQSVVGPPFNPVILPPKELLSLDPAWARCSDFEYAYNLFDPPRVLTTVPAISSLATSASPTSESRLLIIPSAQPGNTLSPNLPANTARPDAAQTERSSSTTNVSQNDYALSSDPAHSSTLADSTRSLVPIDPGPGSSATGSLDDPGLQSSPTIGFSSSADPPLASTARDGNDAESTKGIGGLLHSVLIGHVLSENPGSLTEQDTMTLRIVSTPKVELSARPSAIPLNPNVLRPESSPPTFDTIALNTGGPRGSFSGEPTFTAGGQAFTVSSSGLLVAGSTIIAGGSGLTVSGLPISLVASDILAVGSSMVDAARVMGVPVSSAFAMGGATFAIGPSGLSFADTRIMPGSAAITVSGTPITLDPSGKLMVGSSTTVLPSVYQSFPHPSSILTINGATITANPSGLAINDTTLIVGGAAMTISGTPFSLDSSGKLRIGTSETLLPTGADNSTVPFLGAARAKIEVPVYMVYLIGTTTFMVWNGLGVFV